MNAKSMPFSQLDISELDKLVRSDRQLKAFCLPTTRIAFGIRSDDTTNNLICVIEEGLGRISRSDHTESLNFSLYATKDVWARFFQAVPDLGFQSFLAMARPKNSNIDPVARVDGDEMMFAQHLPICRRVLEIIFNLAVGDIARKADPEPDVDHIAGRYLILQLPHWGGRCKIYYEQSGRGEQDILFLHTAGSDGRQYHGVMNDPRMLNLNVRMTVFDLPSHGRSFPPDDCLPGEHFNSEDRYIEVIAAVIAALGLKRTVVSGASMAGLICLGVALRNSEVGAFGTIPVQGCEYVNMKRGPCEMNYIVNQSVFAPEFSYGMMSPFSPVKHKNLVWHTYSGQAFGVYKGDLDFHFGGFDYRGKLGQIDTQKCRVAMLTGEYDWSLRPEMSLATASKIKGCWIKIMKGLGHFPATENPAEFVGHFIEALEQINSI